MEGVTGEVGVRLALERVLEIGERRKNIPGREDSWMGNSMATACSGQVSSGARTHRHAW